MSEAGPVCVPKASIREVVNICYDDGGFSTVIRCVKPSGIVAKFYRAGSPDVVDYQFDLTPIKNSGDTYKFALPVEFWSYPVGYYNADIYYGEQFVRTIRVVLNASPQTGKSHVIESVSECDNKALPNTEDVVECGVVDCPDIEDCEPIVTRVGHCCE